MQTIQKYTTKNRGPLWPSAFQLLPLCWDHLGSLCGECPQVFWAIYKKYIFIIIPLSLYEDESMEQLAFFAQYIFILFYFITNWSDLFFLMADCMIVWKFYNYFTNFLFVSTSAVSSFSILRAQTREDHVFCYFRKFSSRIVTLLCCVYCKYYFLVCLLILLLLTNCTLNIKDKVMRLSLFILRIDSHFIKKKKTFFGWSYFKAYQEAN